MTTLSSWHCLKDGMLVAFGSGSLTTYNQCRNHGRLAARLDKYQQIPTLMDLLAFWLIHGGAVVTH